MNREIKFRAFTKRWGMIYSDDKNFEININSRIVWKGFCDEEMVPLMQFTGIFDRNNKEIYEGDFVEYDGRDGVAIVMYDCEDGSYYLEGKDLSWIDLFEDKRRWYRCEVIGNIYENPELLK